MVCYGVSVLVPLGCIQFEVFHYCWWKQDGNDNVAPAAAWLWDIAYLLTYTCLRVTIGDRNISYLGGHICSGVNFINVL